MSIGSDDHPHTHTHTHTHTHSHADRRDTRSNLEFSLLPKDTATRKLQGSRNQTADLQISGRPSEPQLTQWSKHVGFFNSWQFNVLAILIMDI